MTAKGKINGSNVRVGDRILIDTAGKTWDGNVHIGISRTKTGATTVTARVIRKSFRAAQGPYERRGKYIIETTEGAIEAAPIETMWLAPEDAAGVKRAHVEALAMDAEFDRLFMMADTIENATQALTAQIEMNDAWNAGVITAAMFDTLNRRMAYKADRWKSPEVGDVVIRESNGIAYEVKSVSDSSVTVYAISSLAVAAIDPAAFHDLFYILSSGSWKERADRCDNGWHKTGGYRAESTCPHCPV